MIENVEFFFEGGRAGVLLIHGLTGTPNEMRLLGKGLHRAGFTVYGMQLAGHCGDEQDLLATDWQDWYRSVEEAAAKLMAKVDHFFVGGLSMGALLALKLAADQPNKVAGVGVYGPTFCYDGWSIPFYERHLFLLLRVFNLFFILRIFKALNLYKGKRFIEQPPYGLKDERLRATVSASMFSGDSASAGLAGNPYGSLAEMLFLASQVQRQLPQVQAPCLIMHALEDDIANISNSRLVEQRVSGATRFVTLDDSYHLITIDRERKEVVRQSVQMFQEIVQRRLVMAANKQTLLDVFPMLATADAE